MPQGGHAGKEGFPLWPLPQGNEALQRRRSTIHSPRAMRQCTKEDAQPERLEPVFQRISLPTTPRQRALYTRSSDCPVP